MAAREWVDAYVTQGHVAEDQPFAPLHPDPVLDYKMNWDVEHEDRTYEGRPLSASYTVNAPSFTGSEFLPSGDVKITRYDSVSTSNTLTRAMVSTTLLVHSKLEDTTIDYEPCGVDLMNVWLGVLPDADNWSDRPSHRPLWCWRSDTVRDLEEHFGEIISSNSKYFKYWDDHYREPDTDGARSDIFDRLPNGSIVHIDSVAYDYNSANPATADWGGFTPHKLYAVAEGRTVSSQWRYNLRDPDTGQVIRIPGSNTGSNTFGRVTHVYGCAYQDSEMLWGQRNPDSAGDTFASPSMDPPFRGECYRGHTPCNMRMYDFRDAPEDKRYIRPIWDWDGRGLSNGLSTFKALWNNTSCPTDLSQFDFVVKGTYDASSDNGNHEKYGPRVVHRSGGAYVRRCLQEGDTFTVKHHMYDAESSYPGKPWSDFPEFLGFGHLRLQFSGEGNYDLDSTCWVNEPEWLNGVLQDNAGNWVQTARHDIQKATFTITPTRVPVWFDDSGWSSDLDTGTRPFLINVGGTDRQVRREDRRSDNMFRLEWWPRSGPDPDFVTYADIQHASSVNAQAPSKTMWVTSGLVPLYSYWPWIDDDTVKPGLSSRLVAKGTAAADTMHGEIGAGQQLTLHKWKGEPPWNAETTPLQLYSNNTGAVNEPLVVSALSLYTATLAWNQPEGWTPGHVVGSKWGMPFQDQVLTSTWAGSLTTYRPDLNAGNTFNLDDNTGLSFTLLAGRFSHSTYWLLDASTHSSLPQNTKFSSDQVDYYIYYNGSSTQGYHVMAKRSDNHQLMRWSNGTDDRTCKIKIWLDLRSNHCLHTSVRSVAVTLKRFNFDYNSSSLGYSSTYYDFTAVPLTHRFNFPQLETVKYAVEKVGSPPDNQHSIADIILTGAARDTLRLVPLTAEHSIDSTVTQKVIYLVPEDQRLNRNNTSPTAQWRMWCKSGDSAGPASWGWHAETVFTQDQMYTIQQGAWGPDAYLNKYDANDPWKAPHFCDTNTQAKFSVWTREGNGLKISIVDHQDLIDGEHLRAAAIAGGWWSDPFTVGTVFTCKTDLLPFRQGEEYTVSKSTNSHPWFIYEFTGVHLTEEAGVVYPDWHETAELTFDVQPTNYHVEGGPQLLVEQQPKRGFDLPSVALTPHVHLVHELQLVEYAVTGGYDMIALWVDGLNGRKSFFHSSEGLEGAFTVLMNMSGSTTREVDYRILRPPNTYVTTTHYQGDGDHLDPMVPLAPPLLDYDSTVIMGEEVGWTMRPQKATIPTVHMVAPDNGHFGRIVVDSAQACVDPCQFAGTQLGVTLRELKVIAKQRYWNYTSGQFEWRAVWPIHLRFRLLVSPHRRDGRVRSVGN